MVKQLIGAASVTVLAFSFVTCAYAETTSYYGTTDGYAGGITASGEIMDPSAYTAAHPYYPLGEKVTVCWEGCVDVVINDRGSVLDLSPAAAEAIGMLEEGVVDADVSFAVH